MFVVDWLLVWSAVTHQHLYNIGQRLAKARTEGRRPPLPGTFRNIRCICVYRHEPEMPPVLVIADGYPRSFLVVYTLDGEYVGAQYSVSRYCTSLSFDGSLMDSDLWECGSVWDDFHLKRYRTSLIVGDEADFRTSEGEWRCGRISRIATHWFSDTDVWLEHTIAGKLTTVKTVAAELWPAGTKSKQRLIRAGVDEGSSASLSASAAAALSSTACGPLLPPPKGPKATPPPPPPGGLSVRKRLPPDVADASAASTATPSQITLMSNSSSNSSASTSVSSPPLQVSRLRVCTFFPAAGDQAVAALVSMGSALFVLSPSSDEIRMYAAASADEPNPSPMRIIDSKMTVAALAAHTQSRRLFVGGEIDGKARVASFDTQSGLVIHSAPLERPSRFSLQCIAVSSTRVFCGCSDGTVLVLSVDLEHLGQCPQNTAEPRLTRCEC